jgi:dTMP kinase
LPTIGVGVPGVDASRAVGAADSPTDLSGFAALKALMQIRAFRRLWAVLGLSSLGDWLGLLATSTFAAQQVSGSAAKGAAFGGVIAVRMLPALILGPLAGVVADRWDRRYTMVVCDVIRFVLFTSIPTVALLTSDSKVVVGWAAVATFIIESTQMVWAPAKDSSVPNLLPRERLENANQLTLATTYGLAPIASVIVLASFTWIVEGIHSASPRSPVNATHIALYFNALTFLATALTVGFGIKEISGRAVDRPAKRPSLLREFIGGWAYVAQTRLVRGLVFGIFGAFAGAGVVVGTAKFYAQSLGGGDLAFYILFGSIFVGLGIGIVAGPKIVGGLSRRRWFGLSIVWAALAVTALAFAWHLLIGVIGALCVGIGAGMAFLSGTTLLGKEVTDDVRGRVFAFIQTGTQVTLLLTISLSSFLVGLGGSRDIFGFTISTTRPLLLAAGVFGTVAGIAALKQMDDKPGVPLFADVIASFRGRSLRDSDEELPEIAAAGRPLPGIGRFVVFEGGEGAGKSTQMQRLADTLHGYGRVVVTTREPGATPAGARIRSIVLDKPDDEDDAPLAPRAEALLYAADRAHHVATVITPALQRGAVVLSDRYIDSSLAYQGAGRTLPPEEVAWLSRWATGGLKPDLVVLLDIDPAIGLHRAARRSHADRLEAESLAFHQRVRQAFLDLAAADPDRYLVVDATQPIDVIAFTVRDRIHRMLPPAPAAPRPASGSATPLAPTVEPGSWAAFDGDGADGSPIAVGPANRARHRVPDDPVPAPPTDALPPEASPAEIEAATAAAVDAAVTDVDLPLRPPTVDSRWR